MHPIAPSEPTSPGLCGTCRHARRVVTPRSVFLLCELAATDPGFARYPRLPVLSCRGHEPAPPRSSGAPPV